MKICEKKKYIYVVLIFAFAVIIYLYGNSALSLNAEEITSACTLKRTGRDGTAKSLDTSKLLDSEYTTYTSFSGGDMLKVTSETEFSSIYIIWNKIPGVWTLKVEGSEFEQGQNGFLHEYVDVKAIAGKNVNELSIIIPKDITVCDICVFTEGDLPDWVQVWQPSCEKADIMLLSTHSDDEQLFFAGILPYYAGEIGAAVQVVYMTNHWDTTNRPHEQINGLWTVGVRNYPIVGPFPDDADTLSRSGESVENTLKRTLEIFGENKLIEFQVEMIRRFKPQVIIAHDANGEYQHGAHIANTYSLQKALEPAADISAYAESFGKYGTWSVPKTYIHLWEENKIVMNWDIPLESFGGKTAFEVSKEGYLCHRSQQWTWFTRWLTGTNDGETDTITKASQIASYSPCEYGLYRTTVGTDTKADFLDNIILYKDQIIKTPEPSPTEEVHTSSIAPVVTPYINPTEQITQTKDSDRFEDIMIYIAMAACVIAIVIMVIISSKSSKKQK